MYHTRPAYTTDTRTHMRNLLIYDEGVRDANHWDPIYAIYVMMCFANFVFVMNSGTYLRPFAHRGIGPYVHARLPNYGVDLDVLTPYCGRMV